MMFVVPYYFYFSCTLEVIDRYVGLLLAPAEGFGLRPMLLVPFGEKRAFNAVCAYFKPFLETVVFSSNLRCVY